ATAPYPEGATGDASVMLAVTVGEDGAVREAAVEQGDEPFASAAREAARDFRFAPATRDGVPVAAKIRVEILFRPPVVEAIEPEEDEAAPPAGSSTPAPTER